MRIFNKSNKAHIFANINALKCINEASENKLKIMHAVVCVIDFEALMTAEGSSHLKLSG